MFVFDLDMVCAYLGAVFDLDIVRGYKFKVTPYFLEF